MHVEANSVNAFRPTHGSDLTAFGFRVYAILGYERDDELFKNCMTSIGGNVEAQPIYCRAIATLKRSSPEMR